MDSLFTNVAFNRGEGPIEDYTFAERDKVLHSDPVPNSAPWLCFYNAGLHYAYGSIRILYDIRNDQGLPSPTYMPHTKISNGAGGGVTQTVSRMRWAALAVLAFLASGCDQAVVLNPNEIDQWNVPLLPLSILPQ